jgi:hypothetical protein
MVGVAETAEREIDGTLEPAKRVEVKLRRPAVVTPAVVDKAEPSRPALLVLVRRGSEQYLPGEPSRRCRCKALRERQTGVDS